MTINRINQYDHHLTAKYNSPQSPPYVSTTFQPAEKTQHRDVPMDAFAINRMAWEQGRQMVFARRQIRNRVARFF